MAYDALHTIMPIAGWPEERAHEVEISVGADPVLPRVQARGIWVDRCVTEQGGVERTWCRSWRSFGSRRRFQNHV